jgi:tetratricopeptide (TPR) repeat protein
MKEYCHYHPTKPAHWRCPHCGLLCCNACISLRKGGPLQERNLHFCPKCNREAEWVGATNLIEPFWKRLPKFFKYPLSPAPLILIFLLALIGTLASGFALLGVLVRVLLWAVLFNYAFSALKATAEGNLAAPPVRSETITEDFLQVFKQIGIYALIWFVFAWLVPTMGILVAMLFLVAAFFLVPAMLILLVTTGSLLHAVNPAMFIRLAMRIGKGYFLMYFFLFLLGAAPAFVGQFLFPYLPQALSMFFFSLAKGYYTIISYHLMGYVILQYHAEVGYEVDFENFRDPTAAEDDEPDEDVTDNPLLNRVKQMVTEGKLDEAIGVIQSRRQEGQTLDLPLSERYIALLKIRQQKAALLDYIPAHLELLAGANRREEACRMFAQCLHQNPNCRPSAETLFKIGGWFNETGKMKTAVAVYRRLIQAHPQSPLVPKAYFRSAQILHDRLMLSDKARGILNGLIRNYPDSDIVPQAKAYLGQM